LYYFNARLYDATTGRFISLDPVQDGTNWYVYCSNNPLSFKDPTGLEVTQDAAIPFDKMMNNVRDWENKQGFTKNTPLVDRLSAFRDAVHSNHVFANENKDLVANTNKLGWHYVHSSEGWIDFGHFSNAALYSHYVGEFTTKLGGDVVEGTQFFANFVRITDAGTSAFTREDYRSNRLGAEFSTYCGKLGSNFSSISDALSNFLGQYSPSNNPSTVPEFKELPRTQGELESRSYFTNIHNAFTNMWNYGISENGFLTIFSHSKPPEN
ncbi:MAG: RHS repeat-associated core domain-containing protein, partial [Spirochaetales bacterium]|nr:RHS repeat-associated core domain-containing protein [Spirochaetales bacterium]